MKTNACPACSKNEKTAKTLHNCCFYYLPPPLWPLFPLELRWWAKSPDFQCLLEHFRKMSVWILFHGAHFYCPHVSECMTSMPTELSKKLNPTEIILWFGYDDIFFMIFVNKINRTQNFCMTNSFNSFWEMAYFPTKCQFTFLSFLLYFIKDIFIQGIFIKEML